MEIFVYVSLYMIGALITFSIIGFMNGKGDMATDTDLVDAFFFSAFWPLSVLVVLIFLIFIIIYSLFEELVKSIGRNDR